MQPLPLGRGGGCGGGQWLGADAVVLLRGIGIGNDWPMQGVPERGQALVTDSAAEGQNNCAVAVLASQLVIPKHVLLLSKDRAINFPYVRGLPTRRNTHHVAASHSYVLFGLRRLECDHEYEPANTVTSQPDPDLHLFEPAVNTKWPAEMS